ncbi:MAG: hypothetical protein NVSMB64_01060 [Candidatus Velthaea sp.]
MARMHPTVPVPDNEDQRLAALYQYQLLDTPSEELFDAFTRLAAQVCGTTISLISLIDRDRQWCKSSVGLDDLTALPREVAFCAQAIMDDGIFEVPDARGDARFAANPLVTSDPNIRFYAGVPLRTARGEALGTLCVLDREPHILTLGQRASLRAIADAVLEQFEQRRAMLRLFDSSQMELYHVDLQAQRVVFASEAARKNLGYSLAEFSELPMSALLPELAAEGRFMRRLTELRADPQQQLTLRSIARRKNGTTYPIELRVELIATREREIALVFGTDLTETTAAKERIRLLSAAMEAASDAIIIHAEGKTPEESPRIVHVNEAFLRQKGATFAEVVGQRTDMFFGPKTDRNKVVAMREKLMRGESARAEYITYRKDGSHYYAESTARPLFGEDGKTKYGVVVQRDVTDSVMRGMTLELQNERLTTLTSIARGLFSSLDPRDLVHSLLAGVHELTRGTGRLLALRGARDYVVTEDLSIADAASNVVDDFVCDAEQSEFALVSGDNMRAAVRILGPSGTPAYVLDVTSDGDSLVTADIFAIGLLGQYLAVAIRNSALYGELASRRTAVIELNQVKNDLIAMLAHDFKGPLTTIVGFAEVLAEDEQFDDESRRFLGMISSSAMRLAGLATDTLTLSRLEQNELTMSYADVDLVALMCDVTRVFSVTRRIDVRSESDALHVSGDESRLRQVFENLVGNAIKYSPGGEAVEVSLRPTADGVEISVRDRGIGIPAAELPKLFGRFARASNARELGIGGTGFGLYLARTIVELHGGHITVQSKHGSGSTFRAFVPTTAAKRLKNRRVLLLDPAGDARSFVAHTLREEGYAVFVVTAERELLFAIGSSKYDAAIVDVDKLDEKAVDAFVAGVNRRVALVRLGAKRSAARGGWDAALRKPVLIKDLQAAVETAIAHHAAAFEKSKAAKSSPGSA